MENISAHRILSESTQWFDDVQVAVKVRRIGRSDKVAVELLAFSSQVTYGESDCKLKKIACNAAAPHSIASFDHSRLFDHSIERKIHLPDGSLAGIHIRKVVLAFHGVNS